MFDPVSEDHCRKDGEDIRFQTNAVGYRRCTPSGISAMVSDSGESIADIRPVFTSEVSDLDRDTVEAYRTNFRLHSVDHPWNELDDIAFLGRINAVVIEEGKTHPSLAGLLMFGLEHNIVREFPDYQLDFMIPDRGNLGWKDRIVSWDGTWSGNLFGFYSRVMRILTSGNPKPRDIGDDMVRVSDTDLDKCMREMVVNALVNADYSQSGGVRVVRGTDGLSVRNPGWFCIPLSKAMEGGNSDQRNKAVGKMLSLIGVSERAGSGVVNMIHYCKKLGLEPSKFIEESDPSTVTVTLGTKQTVSGSAEIDTLSAEVLSVITQEPGISYREMSSKLGIGTSRIQRIMKVLQDNGSVVRVGGTRGRWEIIS